MVTSYLADKKDRNFKFNHKKNNLSKTNNFSADIIQLFSKSSTQASRKLEWFL